MNQLNKIIIPFIIICCSFIGFIDINSQIDPLAPSEYNKVALYIGDQPIYKPFIIETGIIDESFISSDQCYGSINDISNYILVLVGLLLIRVFILLIKYDNGDPIKKEESCALTGIDSDEDDKAPIDIESDNDIPSIIDSDSSNCTGLDSDSSIGINSSSSSGSDSEYCGPSIQDDIIINMDSSIDQLNHLLDPAPVIPPVEDYNNNIDDQHNNNINNNINHHHHHINNNNNNNNNNSYYNNYKSNNNNNNNINNNNNRSRYKKYNYYNNKRKSKIQSAKYINHYNL